MFWIFKKIYLPLFLFVLFFALAASSLAITREECETKIGKESLSQDDLNTCEGFFNEMISKEESQEKSLESKIRWFNNSISLTTTNIAQTTKEIEKLEEEIEGLDLKVARLNLSLDKISSLLVKRINETYKKGRENFLFLLLSSRSFPEFVGNFKYFKAVQLHDKKLLFQMEEARVNYEEQKDLKKEKQEETESAREELETEKLLLGRQKTDKERFLAETKGNKLRYQQLLQTTRAEIEAIQRIVAGQGECSEVGQVNRGQRIASVISGSSACSTGSHLHFEVRENGGVKNPFGYLRSISLIDDSGGDPHSATGSWDWPLNEPIRLTQGFGSGTWAIRFGVVWYDFHTGIDIVSNDSVVKAVEPGKLSRCSINCGGGNLRYVIVDHDDSDIDTYYLHVNY